MKAGFGLAAGAFAGTGIYSWRIEPHWIDLVRRSLPIAYLPEDLIGATLVQISDLHIGPVVDSNFMIGALERVSALAADIVAVTGDFMTYTGQRDIDEAARVLKHLKPGRLATVAIPGNHEYGQWWAETAVADRLVSRVTDLGIDVIRNGSRDVRGLRIIGFDDFLSPNFRPDDALADYDPSKPAIALCHNPDAVDEPVWNGYQGWILSGHTHGGQCKLPFLRPPILPVRNKRYVAGEYDLFDGRRLYINRGLGYLRRIRFAVRPEITVFTLERA